MASQETERFVAVARHVDRNGRLQGAERFLHQADIGGIIFNNQNVAIDHHRSHTVF
jgi:hypothetical protein